MHIRTIGELHDVINEQAKLISHLKAELIHGKQRHEATKKRLKDSKVIIKSLKKGAAL